MNDNQLWIFINSRGRADKQITYHQIPDEWKHFTRIVVSDEDYDAYQASFPGCLLTYTTWFDLPYLPEQREWVLREGAGDVRYIMFLDDDLVFHYRTSDLKLRKASPTEMSKMLETVFQHLRLDIPIVGISDRFGNNRERTPYKDNTRISRAYAVDRKIFLAEEDLTLAPISPFVMEDFHLALSMLERGHPNRVLYSWAQGDAHGSNNGEGGCSEYRNDAVQRASAFTLASLHPKSVKVVNKTTKGSWSTFDQKTTKGETSRVDVRVGWKIAFKPKKKIDRGITDFL